MVSFKQKDALRNLLEKIPSKMKQKRGKRWSWIECMCRSVCEKHIFFSWFVMRLLLSICPKKYDKIHSFLMGKKFFCQAEFSIVFNSYPTWYQLEFCIPTTWEAFWARDTPGVDSRLFIKKGLEPEHGNFINLDEWRDELFPEHFVYFKVSPASSTGFTNCCPKSVLRTVFNWQASPRTCEFCSHGLLLSKQNLLNNYICNIAFERSTH